MRNTFRASSFSLSYLIPISYPLLVRPDVIAYVDNHKIFLPFNKGLRQTEKSLLPIFVPVLLVSVTCAIL